MNIQNDDPFLRRHGRSWVFSGTVTACQTHVSYQRPSAKLLRSLFFGEPYPLGDTAFTTVLRLEDPGLQADDIVVYGLLRNTILRGDHLVVEAKKQGHHYIARRILSNRLGRQLRPERTLPALVIRLALLGLILLVTALIIGLLLADYSRLGRLILAAVPLGIMVLLLYGILLPPRWR